MYIVQKKWGGIKIYIFSWYAFKIERIHRWLNVEDEAEVEWEHNSSLHAFSYVLLLNHAYVFAISRIL